MPIRIICNRSEPPPEPGTYWRELYGSAEIVNVVNRNGVIQVEYTSGCFVSAQGGKWSAKIEIEVPQ